MKKIIILSLLIVSSIAHSANTVVINEIVFNGLKRVSLETVLSDLPLQNRAVINNEDIANSIKILFNTGYFSEIKILSDEKGIITIQVKEYPIIDRISLHGNKTIKEDVINKILNSKKIELGNPFNEWFVFKAKQELENLYHNLGKFSVTITTKIIPLSRNRIDFKIIFIEGKTTKVRKINIFGNNIFHSKILLSQFKLYRKNKWWNISSNKQYQKQELLHYLDTLRNFYFNRGYARFYINETQIDLTLDKKNIDLSLYITEGMRYSFDSAILHGNILKFFPDIKEYIKIFPGELYSNNKIQEIEYNIRHILSKHGYINPTVSINTIINDVNKTVKLHLYIDVGPCFYVREICFEGNNITKDEVIRREINQTERTQLDYIRVLKDQEKLKRLHYFKTVNTRIEHISDTLNYIDVVHKVEEGNTGNLNLSVGLGTESGVNIEFGMHQDNVLGSGNSVSISGTNNNYQTYAEISVLKPYCSIDNISVYGKFFYNDLNTKNTSLSNYNLKDYGININISYPFIEYNKFNIGLNYTSNYLSKIVPQIVVLRYLESVGIHPKILMNNNSSYCGNTINFRANDLLLISGWTFNNTNHIYFSTHGFRFDILSALTLPGSYNKYYKITVDGSNYIPLDQNYHWILMNSIHVGYAGRICKKESPFYDNFYAGGIGTIRGFRLNSIGPKAAYYNCDYSDTDYTTCSIKNSQDAIGGNAMTLFKTELIIPVTYFNTECSEVARISLFLDTGTIWDTLWKNTEATRLAGIIDYSAPNNIRISGGVALKWMSPIGPVIFSYSKLIKKYTGDIEEPFQFSIGKIW